METEGKERSLEEIVEQENQRVILMQIEAVQTDIHVVYENAKSLARLINRGAGGREVALAITKLQEAKAWLHEALIEAN